MNRHTNSGHMFFTSVQSRRWTREHWWADATKLHSSSFMSKHSYTKQHHTFNSSLCFPHAFKSDVKRSHQEIKLPSVNKEQRKEWNHWDQTHFRTWSAALTFISNNLTAPPTDSLTHFNSSQIHLSYSLLQSSEKALYG